MEVRRRTHWRRWLVLAVGCVLVLGLSAGAYLATGGRVPSAPHVGPPTAAELVARARLATVTVRVSLFRTGTRDGQGFVIDSHGTVVTSQYLLRRASSVLVIDARGVSAEANLIGVDDVTGVAELRAPDLASTHLALGPEKTRAGARVLLPSPGAPSATLVGSGRDVVVGNSHLSGLLELSGAAGQSRAGTPVLDQQGRVVAVVVSDAPTPGDAYAVPVFPALAELTTWARYPVTQRFTPPLISADVKTLVLQAADVPAEFQVSSTRDQSGTAKAWQVIYMSPATFARGGESLSSFVVRYTSESDARSGYQSYLDGEASSGYTHTSPPPQLGDQAVLNTKQLPASSGQGILDRFLVIWRDRNVVAIIELVAYTGDAQAGVVLDLGAKQETRIAADPPGD